MSKNSPYLVAVDGSENSGRAIDFAADLAKKTGSGLVLAHIVSPPSMQPVSSIEEVEPADASGQEEKFVREKILGPAQKAAKKKGIPAETFYDRGNPTRVLYNKAKDIGADMIVMGRSGHGTVAEMVLGSVSNGVVHHSKIPVVLVP